MRDMTALQGIQIEFNDSYVWVNIDGQCALRIKRNKNSIIEIEDNRKPENIKD